MPLWTSLAYAVNAFLLWGGGFWAHQGAGDFSGGYVIHLAAGTSGFVAAAVIGARLKRDREKALPHSLPLVASGPASCGWAGTASTAATPTSPVPTPPPPLSTPTWPRWPPC